MSTSTEALPEPIAPPADGTSARRRMRRGILSSALLWVALAWITVMIGAALLADLLPLASYEQRIGTPRTPPGLTWPEFLGTDQLGRSVLSRVIFGARVSLAVGLVAVTAAALVGGLLGVLAGYLRGWPDKVIGLLLDSMLAFPPLVLLLAITAIQSQSFLTLTLALSLLSVPGFARLVRANTLSLSKREFVDAARLLGSSPRRVLLREVLPNVVLPVLSYGVLVLAGLIVAEGSLSFLGLGIPAPRPSWGGMIASGRPMLSSSPWLTFVPAIALFLTVLSINVIGDHARRLTDKKAAAL